MKFLSHTNKLHIFKHFICQSQTLSIGNYLNCHEKVKDLKINLINTNADAVRHNRSYETSNETQVGILGGIRVLLRELLKQRAPDFKMLWRVGLLYIHSSTFTQILPYISYFPLTVR